MAAPLTVITGGAGFIGSHLGDHFLAKGHEVVVIDNLLTGALENIEHLRSHPKFTFLHKDVTNYIKGGNDNNINSTTWGPHEGPQTAIYSGKGGYEFATPL